MLSDRSYMRDTYPSRTRGALPWIISAIVAGFILENVFVSWFKSGLFTEWCSLSITGISHGHLWQLLTYGFVHQAGELVYVLLVGFNLLWVYFLGRELEQLLGTKRFLVLYLGGILLGGLAWTSVNYRFGGANVGAWPGIAAMFTFYALLNPNQQIPLLVFFVFPVTLKPKYIAWTAFAVETVGLVAGEMRGESAFGMDHSAHLGGMLAGCLYFFLVHQREWRTPDGRSEVELPRWFKKSAPAVTQQPKYKVNITSREDLKAEVDRILDKINSEGFGALTAEEKKILDEAKDLLSRS